VAAVAGERKAVTSDPVPRESQQAACLEALIRRTEKTFVGESTGETSGALDRDSSMPCMPVVSGLEIGSLGNQVERYEPAGIERSR